MAFFNKRYHPPGTAPGTLVEMSPDSALPLDIRLIDYDKECFTCHDHVDAAGCKVYIESDSVTWLHVQGHPTETALAELGRAFSLHDLALEDVLNIGQRPKVEPFDDQLFIVMALPVLVGELVEVNQVSIFLGENFLVSFYEHDLSVFEPIVKRLKDKKSRLRSRGADFLLYSLLDLIIDQGFPILEGFGMQLEELEDKILSDSSTEVLGNIHTLKRELILLRRILWPQRDVVNQLLRDDHPLIQESSLIYLRDCYDHTVHVMDLLETYRDMGGSMLDIYLSSVSNRMNSVMRVLTVISTIFIPLTFVVGVYGMNFDRSAGPWSMPELGWAYGYPMIWGIMTATVVLMLFVFRRKGWF